MINSFIQSRSGLFVPHRMKTVSYPDEILRRMMQLLGMVMPAYYGFHNRPLTGATWQDVFSYAYPLNGGGQTGNTVRQFIDSTQLGVTGGTKVRATFRSSATEALTVGIVYIGVRSAGDLYDFDSAPTELQFSAGSGFAIAANTEIVSDETTFVVPSSGEDLAFSFYVSGDATHDGLAANNSIGAGNAQFFYKAGNDASTQNASGYTVGADGTIRALIKLEVYA